MKSWDTLKNECPFLYVNGIIFECGLGWYDLIRDLSIKIERILEDYNEVNPWVEGQDNIILEIYAIQVKEKYGTLRFYLNVDTQEIRDLIEEAEALSLRTCDCCGAPGRMRNMHWFAVRCDKCWEEKI